MRLARNRAAAAAWSLQTVYDLPAIDIHRDIYRVLRVPDRILSPITRWTQNSHSMRPPARMKSTRDRKNEEVGLALATWAVCGGVSVLVCGGLADKHIRNCHSRDVPCVLSEQIGQPRSLVSEASLFLSLTARDASTKGTGSRRLDWMPPESAAASEGVVQSSDLTSRMK
jgi:hypothetical protein